MKINNNKIKSLFLLSLAGSGLAKEEKANNQTEISSNEINVNPLPQMATNFTHGKVTKRDNPEQKILMAAGSGITKNSGSLTKDCTSGFTVVNSDINCNGDFGGFLVSFSCLPIGKTDMDRNVYDLDGSVLLGLVSASTQFINTDPDLMYISAALSNVKLTPYVQIITDEGKTELIPVSLNTAGLPSGGQIPACVSGAVGGYQCGELAELNVILTIPSPWGEGTITFNGLVKVDLGVSGLAEGDIGAPVFLESQIGGRTFAGPAGHVTTIDNSDPNHHYFYYTQIDDALSLLSRLSGCTYNILAYDDTNAQEYDQLLAQMEVPAKK